MSLPCQAIFGRLLDLAMPLESLKTFFNDFCRLNLCFLCPTKRKIDSVIFCCCFCSCLCKACAQQLRIGNLKTWREKVSYFQKFSWNQILFKNSVLLHYYVFLFDFTLLIWFLESLENVERTLEAHARVCSLLRKKCGCDIPNYRFYIHMKSRYIFSTKLICFPYSRYLFLYGIDTLCMNPWPLYFTHV